MTPPTRKPQPKVVAGGVAGAVSILVVYALTLAGVEVPPEVASALTVVAGFVAAYLKRSNL